MWLLYGMIISGIFEFRTRDYWKWVGTCAAWIIGAQCLFLSAGLLAKPLDGAVLWNLLLKLPDAGSLQGIIIVGCIVLYYGVLLFIVIEGWKTGSTAKSEVASASGKPSQSVGLPRRIGESVVVLGLIFTVQFVWVVLLVDRSAGASQGPAGLDRQVSAHDPRVSQELALAAAGLNKLAPLQIDPFTRLVRASSENLSLTYHYQILAENLSREEFQAQFPAHLLHENCNNPIMKDMMKKHGVAYRYSYQIPGLVDALVVEVNAGTCRSVG